MFLIDFGGVLDGFRCILDGFLLVFGSILLDFGWILDRVVRFWLVLDGFLLPADLPGLCLVSSFRYLGCTCASYVPSCISPSYLPGSSASPHRIQEVSGCFGMDFGLI